MMLRATAAAGLLAMAVLAALLFVLLTAGWVNPPGLESAGYVCYRLSEHSVLCTRGGYAAYRNER